MKNFYCSVLALLISFSVMAEGENKTGFLTGKSESGFAMGPAKSDKPIISNGLYLGLTFGNPSFTILGTDNLGLQFGIDLGNQWMFVKNDQWGLGMNVSWFSFGYSSYGSNFTGLVGTTASRGFALGLNFLKFGPMFSYALNEKMAIDAYFNVTPFSLYVGGVPDADYAYLATSAFTTFAPGLRFRFKQFMVGFETNFGTYQYYDVDYSDVKFRANFFNPKATLGFKF